MIHENKQLTVVELGPKARLAIPYILYSDVFFIVCLVQIHYIFIECLYFFFVVVVFNKSCLLVFIQSDSFYTEKNELQENSFSFKFYVFQHVVLLGKWQKLKDMTKAWNGHKQILTQKLYPHNIYQQSQVPASLIHYLSLFERRNSTHPLVR